MPAISGDIDCRIYAAGWRMPASLVEYSTYFFAALLVPIFLLGGHCLSRLGIGRAPGSSNARRDHSLSGSLGRTCARIIRSRTGKSFGRRESAGWGKLPGGRAKTIVTPRRSNFRRYPCPHEIPRN